MICRITQVSWGKIFFEVFVTREKIQHKAKYLRGKLMNMFMLLFGMIFHLDIPNKQSEQNMLLTLELCSTFKADLNVFFFSWLSQFVFSGRSTIIQWLSWVILYCSHSNLWSALPKNSFHGKISCLSQEKKIALPLSPPF